MPDACGAIAPNYGATFVLYGMKYLLAHPTVRLARGLSS